MKQQVWGPISVLIIGLVAVGIVAGVQQSTGDDLAGGANAVLAVVSCFGVLAVLVSTWLLLSSILPTPAYQTLSEREGRLGGILIAIPLLIGILLLWVGEAEKSPLFIPLLMLSAVGVSAAFWFLVFCIGHVLAQSGPMLIKAFWIVALILGNLVVMPLYWYLFIWRPHLALLSRRER